jgi:hypothetical protein
MAVAVKPLLRARQAAAAAGLLLAAAGAAAMGSADPFTPPPSSRTARPAGAVSLPGAQPPAQGPGTASPAGTAASTPALAGLRLGRHGAALIDGNWVPLGGSVRGARLVALTPLGASLQHDDGHREFMPLNPDIQFSPRTTTPPAGPGLRPAKSGR